MKKQRDRESANLEGSRLLMGWKGVWSLADFEGRSDLAAKTEKLWTLKGPSDEELAWEMSEDGV